MSFKTTNKRLSRNLTLFYLVISLILIYVEYIKDPGFLYLFKPLLMPILFWLYLLNKKQDSKYFVLAILFMWIANIIFINANRPMFIIGALNTFISRIFVLILILKYCKPPKLLPFLIATFPFLMIFITVFQLVNDNLGDAFYFYIINGLLVVIVGGVSLANYILFSNRINTYILISVILFTGMQFIVAIDFYYLSIKVFRPIAIILYSVAQYLLYKAVVKMKYKKVNDIEVIQ
jgi:YhhN-like protein